MSLLKRRSGRWAVAIMLTLAGAATAAWALRPAAPEMVEICTSKGIQRVPLSR